MDIEPKLREMLVLKDPGTQFTDKVLARVGDVPSGPSPGGVAHIADARAGRRGRRLVLGALLVAVVAAATLPLWRERVAEQAVPHDAEMPMSPGEAAAADSFAPPLAAAAEPLSEDGLLDCIDPDVLHGLLLPGATREFRVDPVIPPHLADFKPPRQLAWLGAAERSTGSIAISSAVYRSELAPEAARAAAGEALVASGWTLQADGWSRANSVFGSSASMQQADTYCREGQQLALTVGALDGINYVVMSQNRTEGGASVPRTCDASLRPFAGASSPFDEFMPVLELPPDPVTGTPAVHGGVNSGGSNAKRRHSVSFRLNDSIDSVARHFASQMAAQGWLADTAWGGEGTAGSTWTRRVDDEVLLHGMLSVSAFEDQRFTVVFRVLRAQ